MAWSSAPATRTPDTVRLPAPRLRGLATVEESLAKRRSVREFQERDLSWEDIGQLLWACQGVTDPQGLRTAPSAGALYPLDVFVVTPSGVYRYHPGPHEVRRIGDQWRGDPRVDSCWSPGCRIGAERWEKSASQSGGRSPASTLGWVISPVGRLPSMHSIPSITS